MESAEAEAAREDDRPVMHLEMRGRLAIATIDYPPVNALGHAVRSALLEAIRTVTEDPAIMALVIRCAGSTFIAGADIREFDRAPERPFLPEVVDALESCPKLVVAAIHGTALGGGLEVAMGCHFRVAVPAARLGLPEVKLGLMPGAGGTQRLPRLIGVPKALEMMTTGTPIGAREALALGLVDEIVEDDLLEGAIAFVEARLRETTSPRATRDRVEKLEEARGDGQLFERFLAANMRKFRGLDAPKAIVEVIRRGLELPFDEAVAGERAAFLRLREGPQSRALRYVFAAERAAGRIADLPAGTSPLPVARVGIVGGGTMGTGIAVAFLQAGFPVTLVETTPEGVARAAATIGKTLERNVGSGRMSSGAADEARARLLPTLDYDDLASADLVIEAAFETMAVKRDIFARLDQVAGADAILATNTSYLDVEAIAAATSRPEQVVGLHFFSPANIMKLLEVVRTPQTSPQVIATALKLAKSIGKIAAVSGNAYGFIGNRMLAIRRREADKLILEGASPWDVDRVMVEFGMPMGPFQISDLAGLDLGWSRETSTGSTIRELLCERDRRGQKTAGGFYDYDEQRRPIPSPLTEDLIADLARQRGIAPRSIDDVEILDRLLLPMINEGAKILEEGVALRASDIDVVWIHGYGWPAWRGGPMYYADGEGLPAILAKLRVIAGREGDEYRPAPLLERLAGDGRGFAGPRE